MENLELKGFLQIGIVVEDIRCAVACWEAMGVGPWKISDMRTDKPPCDDITFDGKKLEKGIIMYIATTECYGFELELIQPVMDTQFKHHLEKYGPGLHHLAFNTKTPYNELLQKHKNETGKDPWVRGQGIGGKMDFSYLDLRKEMGMILECHSHESPNKPVLPYDVKLDVKPEGEKHTD